MIEKMKNELRGKGEQTLLGLPVDRRVLFSDAKGIYKPGIQKRQTKLIERISFVKPFLKEGEKIVLVTTGCSPISVLEQFLTGWLVFYLKRCLLVFTDRRIFHIPTRANYSYRNSMAQILYGDCEKISLKGGALVVQYKSGEKERFNYVASRERRKIKALLETISLAGEQSKTGRRTHLCPRCARELNKDQYTCTNCRLAFKDRAEGKRISILYPGGGYFYTDHPFLGIGDAITELFLMILVVVSVIGVARGFEQGIFLLVLSGVLLVLEKVVSVFHSNHFIEEYIPKEKEIRPRIER
jgi:hypothetical protein